MTFDFDYKKYSLDQLDNWMHDAMSCGGATPQEIYDTIRKVVEENYYTYKHQTSQAYELLTLLNGNGGWKVEDVLKEREYYDGWDKGIISNRSDTSNLTCDKDDPSPECQKSWNDFWEDSMPPWGHSDMEALRYTEEELNAMCDKAASDSEKEQCREYNLREAEYYNKRAELDLNPGPHQKYVGWTAVKESKFNEMFSGKEKHKSDVKEQISRNDSNRIDYKDGLIYESPDGGKTVYSRKPGQTEKTLVKEEKKNKWTLPVEEIDNVQFITFPQDLLDAANLKEGDEVEWVDNKDGSFILKKISLMHHPV